MVAWLSLFLSWRNKMKKLIMFSIIFFGFSSANAALYDRGGGLIYDDELDITWLQDANYVDTSGYDDAIYGTDYGGLLKWADAVLWAESLEYYDPVRDTIWKDWRLPVSLPINGFSYQISGPGEQGWYNGTSDLGYNMSAPGTAYEGSTGSEMAHLYYNSLGNIAYLDPEDGGYPQDGWGNLSNLNGPGPFINLEGNRYWSSTTQMDDHKFAFSFGMGFQDNPSANGDWYAWAVMDGDVAAVPLPPSVLFLGSGFICIAAMRKLIRK
jgi:hypothetical protein